MLKKNIINFDVVLEAHAIAIEELAKKVIEQEAKVRRLESELDVIKVYLIEGWRL